MAFTDLEKYVYFKKCLKQRRQPPPHPSLQQSRKYFRAEKVTRLRLLFAIEFAYPADRVTKSSVYRSPLKVTSYSPGSGRLFLKCRVSEQLSQIIEYVQLNKTAYADFKSLSMSSTQVVALVPTSTSASITLISAVHVVLIEFMKTRYGITLSFKVSVGTIVITKGLIKFCKKIKESTSYAECRSLFVVAER